MEATQSEIAATARSGVHFSCMISGQQETMMFVVKPLMQDADLRRF
jgi:hypothetical protein